MLIDGSSWVQSIFYLFNNNYKWVFGSSSVKYTYLFSKKDYSEMCCYSISVLILITYKLHKMLLI